MREIKFRAWDEKKKEMHFDSKDNLVVFRVIDGKILLSRKGGLFNGESPVWCETDDIMIMQYTGLKDKNGDKDVYEYDIISKDGLVIGNKYETPTLLKDTTNIIIEGFGEENWQTTNKKALDRGCFYPKRYANKNEFRNVE